MAITLPDAVRAEAEAKAKAAGYQSVEEYIADLIAEDVPEDDMLPTDYTPPPELTPRNREELERMIEEGMNSGPGVIADEAFWAERRRVLRERLARRRRAGGT
jgi:predicted kinase